MSCQWHCWESDAYVGVEHLCGGFEEGSLKGGFCVVHVDGLADYILGYRWLEYQPANGRLLTL